MQSLASAAAIEAVSRREEEEETAQNSPVNIPTESHGEPDRDNNVKVSEPDQELPEKDDVSNLVKSLMDQDIHEFAHSLSRLWKSSHEELPTAVLCQFLKKVSLVVEGDGDSCDEEEEQSHSTDGSMLKPLKSIVPETTIVCNAMVDGQCVHSAYSEYFGKNVEVFSALSDKTKTVLYKSSTLTAHIGCAPNQIAMHIARKKEPITGIYQALDYIEKPRGRSGLKKGSYFLCEEACRTFGSYFSNVVRRKKRTRVEEVAEETMMTVSPKNQRISRQDSPVNNFSSQLAASFPQQPLISIPIQPTLCRMESASSPGPVNLMPNISYGIPIMNSFPMQIPHHSNLYLSNPITAIPQSVLAHFPRPQNPMNNLP